MPLTFVEEVTQDEEQDYSDEDEYTDASDLLDDESEECEQMLEERKAIFSILTKP